MTIKSLVEKYSKTRKRGLTYKMLLKEVVAHNTEKISRGMGRISETRYRSAADRALGRGVLELPAWEEVMPPRAYFLHKGQESGEIITDTLRRRLTANLRSEMETLAPGGRLDPAILPKLEAKIRATMGEYTRTRGGTVANAKLIANFEARTAFNESKFEYAKKMALVNTDKVALGKTWHHNNQLVKKGRPGHIAVHGVSVGFYETFKVSGPEGIFQMRYPHDTSVPISERAGCQCDYDIVVTLLPGAKA